MRKLYSSLGVKLLFVALYITANIWAALVIIDKNELIADHASWPAPTAEQILYALMLIISSYILIFFIGNEKEENEPKYKKIINSKAFSVTIFCIQLIFFAFVIIYSAGSAGGDMDKGGGALRFIFYVINPDMLFLVYYAATMYAKSKIPYRNSNLVLFFISNIARGWIGQALFIVFIGAISWVHSSNRKLSAKKLLAFAVFTPLFFIAASFLMYIKVALRLGFDAVVGLIQNVDFFEVLSGFFEIIFSRLQLISTVSFQIVKKPELTQYIENGTVGNFYTDGLPQQVIYKLLGMSPGDNLNLFLWQNYIPGYFFESQTTFQPGLVAWFYILPYYWILPFIVYIVFLCLLNFKLVSFIGGNGLRHLSWFAILIFLIPSWLGAYVSFIWSLFVFIVMVSLGYTINTNFRFLSKKW